MIKDNIHTAAIMRAARVAVRCLGYVKALVMHQYLSKLIRQMLRMEAVQRRTSIAFHRSHQMEPKYQYPITSFARLNGMITKPSRKSARANEAMNQFCFDFRFLSV